MPQEKRLFSSDSEGEAEYKPANKQKRTSKTIDSSEDESDISDDFSSEEGETKRASKKKKQTPKKAAEKKTAEKKTDVERNAEGDQIFPLSAKRRITVRSFPNGGGPAIDIREVYTDKAGELRPGKGICLPLDQWKKLKAFLPDIEEAIAALPDKKK